MQGNRICFYMGTKGSSGFSESLLINPEGELCDKGHRHPGCLRCSLEIGAPPACGVWTPRPLQMMPARTLAPGCDELSSPAHCTLCTEFCACPHMQSCSCCFPLHFPQKPRSERQSHHSTRGPAQVDCALKDRVLSPRQFGYRSLNTVS